MRLPVRLAIVFVLCVTFCHAQTPSPWQGEWGGFSDTAGRQGERLTVKGCTAQTCVIDVNVWEIGQNCGAPAKTILHLLSPTEADAPLLGSLEGQNCTLHLHRSGTATSAAIAVHATGASCKSYYCTTGPVSFDHTFPQKSALIFTGQYADQCLAKPSVARNATCLDPTLASLEDKWLDLYQTFPLQPAVPPNSLEFAHAESVDGMILQHCNTAAQPSECLRTRWSSDLTAMIAKQQAYIAGSTERGDPAEASRIAAKIAGHYRHTFQNGDVQGEIYKTTDTLTISPVGRNSIHFDTELNFYNGHTCSLSGGALYRKDGSFVFDDDPANALPPEPACRLAIIPTDKGIDFKDLNGSCKNYCGARGSFNAEGFTFHDRVAVRPTAASRLAPK
jgi:hypothetical protein